MSGALVAFPVSVKQNSLLTFSRNRTATTAYFARPYRHPGSAILLQRQVSKASIAKIGRRQPQHLPLYQGKTFLSHLTSVSTTLPK